SVGARLRLPSWMKRASNFGRMRSPGPGFRPLGMQSCKPGSSTESMDLHPDFRDLLSALAATSAEYLVVGGWAVGYHAGPRLTQDLDVFIGPSNENLEAVARALARFGAPRGHSRHLARPRARRS